MSAQITIKMTAEEFDTLRELVNLGINTAKIQAGNEYANGNKNAGWKYEALETAGKRLLSGPMS